MELGVYTIAALGVLLTTFSTIAQAYDDSTCNDGIQDDVAVRPLFVASDSDGLDHSPVTGRVSTVAPPRCSPAAARISQAGRVRPRRFVLSWIPKPRWSRRSSSSPDSLEPD